MISRKDTRNDRGYATEIPGKFLYRSAAPRRNFDEIVRIGDAEPCLNKRDYEPVAFPGAKIKMTADGVRQSPAKK
jgi:hypothetical protein